jgi:hypothetical protein
MSASFAPVDFQALDPFFRISEEGVAGLVS